MKLSRDFSLFGWQRQPCDLHEMKGTIRDQKKFLICIHQTFEELSHIRRFFYVFLYMFTDDVMHNGMARTDGVLAGSEESFSRLRGRELVVTCVTILTFTSRNLI
jgi:hypothetical protein